MSGNKEKKTPGQDPKYLEKFIEADDDLVEYDVEPDVFYDFFFSLPMVKYKNKYNAMVEGYFKKLDESKEGDLVQLFRDRAIAETNKEIEKLRAKRAQAQAGENWAAIDELDGEIEQLEQDLMAETQSKDFQEWALYCKTHYEEYKRHKKTTEHLQNKISLIEDEENDNRKQLEKELKESKKLEEEEKRHAEIDLRNYLDSQLSIFTLLDSFVFKNLYATAINLVVLFLIFVIMVTIPSRGLPGRQQVDGTTFTVILKADRTVTPAQRFTDANAITDVCQGLGWWMHDDRSFSLESVTWPEGENLRVFTKQHWDKNLNVEYTCPTLADGYKSQFGGDTPKQTCTSKVQPAGQSWVHWETGSFFLFQDQCLRFSHPLPGPTCSIKGPEVYHEKCSVATLKATGQAKEFTVMAGNMNEKVQMLQPIESLKTDGNKLAGPDGTLGSSGGPRPQNSGIKVFWVARDRIFPSEWAVQSLFNIPWNGKKGWDENVVVGGFNEFGRRPSAIVKANGVQHYGKWIEEAIWQYVERSCWHKPGNQRMNWNNELVDQQGYIEKDGKARSKYDKFHTGKDLVTWEGLDQDQRAWWRALGLGVDRSACNGANTKVTTDNKCISGKAGCTRVNYHTAKRWENDANNDALAKQRFDARDFSVIFRTYECANKTLNAAGDLEMTELTAPETSPLTWDNIDAGAYEDGRFMNAATNLGYDEDEWNAHALAPRRPEGPPDNLVLVVENYLEGEAYYSLFLYTQMICSLIMIATSMIEIRHIFAWWSLTTPRPSGKRTFLGWIQTTLSLKTLLSPRLHSAIAALLQYIVIPVFTIEVSLLLILESANVVDCIKDTIALLFLLEINNYLQIRKVPDSGKWKIKMKKGKISSLERQKNIFSLTLFVVFFSLAWVTSWVVIFSSRYHHSLIFNPWGDQYSDNVWSTWICVVLHGIIGAVFFISEYFVTKVVDTVTKTEAYNKYFVPDREEEGFLSNLLEAAVPTDNVDDAYYEDEEESEDDEGTHDEGPETTPEVRQVNPDSVNAGPNDYVGRWTYKPDDKAPPLEGPLLWKLNDPKPVLFPPASNQGVMYSTPPPAVGAMMGTGTMMNASLTYPQQTMQQPPPV